ncbi:MAG: TldD/PmbA family protein [Actinobacteria bacterium]|nr:TldD/PmbA family protein [Actinomycetota bacterium]
MPRSIDARFLNFPFDRLADAALQTAKDLGATYADFRFEVHRAQSIFVKDHDLQSLSNGEGVGFGVRVIIDGSRGYASDVRLAADAVAAAVRRAIDLAKQFRGLNSEPVELADEPDYTDTYVSAYEVNPFDVGDDEKIAFVRAITEKVLSGGKVDHVDMALLQVEESKFFANMTGSRITQQRIRVSADFEATKVNKQTGAFETMASTSPPVGRGWEFFSNGGYDYMADAERIPALLEEKIASPSIEPGTYDLVIHPSNLWLTIHESIGHSTELDRVLGFEATLAGTSFAKLEQLGELKIGSDVMNVTGDRVTDDGVATVGYDDEGVKAQRWDIIKDGTLVGYQLNRQMARKLGVRSNGCAYADSPANVPIQRMPNVTLQPGPDPISLDDLIGGVERGIYIVGNKSWSIDQQRYNFQFTGQQFWEIKGGKLTGQLKDVAYQGNTIDFWNSMEAVGGPETFILFGTFNCGKGLPGQGAPAGHGCPAGLFRGIKILNTVAEGAR